eukprot:s2497_g1.t1
MHRMFAVAIAMPQEGELLPLQGAWYEVYGGYGAYTKLQHRRGNSLDDMDSGSMEDTRGSARGADSWQKRRSVEVDADDLPGQALRQCEWRRELTTGKRYQAAEFQQSISAIPPLIANSNGRYAVVRARERMGTLYGMDFDVLQEGSGGVAVSGLGTAAPPMTKLEAVIGRAIGKS